MSLFIYLSFSELTNFSGLTSDQAGATLEYLLSCGARLSQMTRTYHDLEAVTRLLEEKEKDLELAAKIGQELLERNRYTKISISLIISNSMSLEIIGNLDLLSVLLYKQ